MSCDKDDQPRLFVAPMHGVSQCYIVARCMLNVRRMNANNPAALIAESDRLRALAVRTTSHEHARALWDRADELVRLADRMPPVAQPASARATLGIKTYRVAATNAYDGSPVAETHARYLATYGAATLRAMAAEYRMFANARTGRRLPLRFAVAANAVAALGLCRSRL